MRLDLQLIPQWIKQNTNVLDLGCGDGKLLSVLTRTKNVYGLGVEIDSEQISLCIAEGLNVVEQDLNDGLSNFENDSFDTVVMTHALQTLRNPHLVLDEMLRIGKECIVTFPNFGHWRCRLYLMLKGRMPVSKFLPYSWYDTPNIHFCTIRDFDALCHEKNIKIKHRVVVAGESTDGLLTRLCPNLFGLTAVYHISK
ncbi:methionine biosynthesis protein MetW [Dasania sp. GY-MA-18]|uniref:Methionine biosynthesis protein MetW n=1 Tax=Dasania phycosphaerae TaxID=2950436 RepID=A0A9J6RJN9_9GAMM|nr:MULTISPECIES: methionine biosynthesis protein MetW [Dasania]MCR8922474.1 methionine biosynthesis protein MetW [Dasania sp. GY-MA-18]MCZ0864902.1 methionine biosynthesis protein MetW [Dasania phycosphaerae]MCZ0868630.1 methionine biosynthesis protein MetW [Dasania phycosphaerae]